MATISSSELRDRTGEVLRRVETGESFRVTDSGRLVALIVPAAGDALDGLVARGEARPARTRVDALLAIVRTKSPTTSRALRDDAQRSW